MVTSRESSSITIGTPSGCNPCQSLDKDESSGDHLALLFMVNNDECDCPEQRIIHRSIVTSTCLNLKGIHLKF